MKGYLKTWIRGTYDLQNLRIMTGSRIVANFKTKLGQEPGDTEKNLEREAKNILKTLRASYAKLTDGLIKFPKFSTFTGDNIISNYTELGMISHYLNLEKEEKEHFSKLKFVLQDYAVWNEFLEPTKGIGPALGGVIIAEIDITKAKHPSSLWRYAGLDVAEDGLGRSRKKHHLVDTEYTDKNGEIKMKKGITYNPFLKSKLIGVGAGSLLKAANEDYAPIYYDYKERLEHHKKYKDTTKLHRHNMALRYMIKMFLIDLYTAWRKLENLTVSKPYSEAKLDMKHGTTKRVSKPVDEKTTKAPKKVKKATKKKK